MIKETKNVIGNNLYINDSEEEYLEKINIIGNKLVQDTREGYNLNAMADNSGGTISGTTWSIKNSEIILNGSKTGGDQIPSLGNRMKLGTFQPGTYSLILYPLSGSITGLTAGLFITDANTGGTSIASILTNQFNIVTITITETKTLYGYIYQNAGTIWTNCHLGIMIAKGELTEKPKWEQYGASPSINYPSELKYVGGNYDIEVSNRNIWIPTLTNEDVNIKTVNCTVELNDDIYKCTATGLDMFFGAIFTTDGINYVKSAGILYKIKNHKTLSILISNAQFNKNYVQFYDKDKKTISYIYRDINNFKINIPENAEYFVMRIGRGDSVSGTVYETKIDIRLDEDLITDYIKHEGGIYPLDLTNYPLYSDKDYIYKKDGKWFVHNERNEKIIKSTDLTNNVSVEVGTNIVKYNVKNILTNGALVDRNKIATNMFVSRYGDDTDTEHIRNGASAYPNNLVLYVSKTNLSSYDLAGLKSLLNNKPLQVIYEIEPTETEITDGLLISQLEAIENIYTYKGITHININGSEILPLLDITYVSNIEEYDFYITKNNRFIIKDKNINQIYSPQESEIPDIAEATESTVKIAGKDGDLVLATKYEPLEFKLVTYSEENLELEEKIKEQSKIISFLNSIKNETKKIAFLDTERMIDVKYYNKLQTIKYPKSLRFEIPLKSSNSYSTELKKKKIIGNNEKNSDTIENTGCIITIKGPASTPTIALNDYQIIYYNELLAGNKLVIDTGNSTITHITSKGIETNAAIYYNHEYPKIKNGTNELKIQSGIENPNQVSVEWFDLKN